MGIKFDILLDHYLLNEASEFSRFFTGLEPIKTIHDKLKVSHDTKLVLSQTNNRHDLWGKLREGKAIFAVINKPELYKNATNTLKDLLRTEQPAPNRRRTFNEIKSIIKSFMESIAIDVGKNETISSSAFEAIKNRIHKPGGLLSKINEVFPNSDALSQAVKNFESSLMPGEYIFVKRGGYAEDLTKGYQKKEFKQIEGVKETNQQYHVFYFDKEKLLKTRVIQKNAIHVYRELFPGWGDRNFYVIGTESFGPEAKHAFRAKKEFGFAKLLPITTVDIEKFVKHTFSTYEAVIDKKIGEMTNKLKQSAYKNIELINKSDEDVMQSIKDYRNALKILNDGVSQFATPDKFLIFLKTIYNSTDYSFISARKPFKEWDPYSAMYGYLQTKEDWVNTSKEEGLETISLLTTDRYDKRELPTISRENIKARLKSDRENVVYRTINDLNDSYEIWDSLRRRWIPYDADYIENFTAPQDSNMRSMHIAMAFKSNEQFNDFRRKFMLFALRNLIKEPDVRDLEQLASDI